MPSVIYSGEVLNGTAADELIVGISGYGTNHTINADDGDDLVLGEMDYFHTNYVGHTNTSLGNAMNLDGSAWSNSNNPIVNTPGPHTSVYIEPGAGQQRFFSVTVGAGETIVLDVDFADDTGWGGGADTMIDILDGDGNVLASNDDNGSDFGSLGSFDSRVSYTPVAGGEYYIRVREFGAPDGNVFEGGEQIFLNVSVTNHALNTAVFAPGNDVINGGNGDDTIFGMLGTDTVHGDAGNDIIASTGSGSFYGDAGNDIIYAGLGLPELLDGGADVDLLDTTRYGNDYVVDLATGVTNFIGESFVNFENLRTGAGNDTLGGTADSNTMYGGTGNDTINGLGGGDILFGEAGNDTVNGGEGNDLIYGGGGLDLLDGGNGDDSVTVTGIVNGAEAHGGIGTDTLILQTVVAGAITVNLNGNTVQGANTMVTEGFENFNFAFQSNDVTLIAGIGNNAITTGSGNDTIVAGGGTDTIVGGAGNDTILQLNLGSVDGGDGIDTIDYTSFGVNPGTYYADLGAGISLTGFAGPYFATYANLENYVGLIGGSDQVRGTAGVNVISGVSGNDVLSGRGGNDTLNGGDDDDRLNGDGGDDVLYGDAGNDVINGGAGNDGMFGGFGDDIFYVRQIGDSVIEGFGAGADVVRANIDYTLQANIEELFIGGAADNGTGNALDNTLHGSGSNNGLFGLDGDDVIRGGGGRDTIEGGNGEDLIDGGVGKDTMTGGADRDVFQFRDGDFGATRPLADVITDFSKADNEKIHLGLVDASTVAGGNQAFTWIGNGAFTGVAGQLHYAHQAGNTYVEGDTNGDGTADFVIALTGLLNLAASDFVL